MILIKITFFTNKLTQKISFCMITVNLTIS